VGESSIGVDLSRVDRRLGKLAEGGQDLLELSALLVGEPRVRNHHPLGDVAEKETLGKARWAAFLGHQRTPSVRLVIRKGRADATNIPTAIACDVDTTPGQTKPRSRSSPRNDSVARRSRA